MSKFANLPLGSTDIILEAFKHTSKVIMRAPDPLVNSRYGSWISNTNFIIYLSQSSIERVIDILDLPIPEEFTSPKPEATMCAWEKTGFGDDNYLWKGWRTSLEPRFPTADLVEFIPTDIIYQPEEENRSPITFFHSASDIRKWVTIQVRYYDLLNLVYNPKDHPGISYHCRLGNRDCPVICTLDGVTVGIILQIVSRLPYFFEAIGIQDTSLLDPQDVKIAEKKINNYLKNKIAIRKLLFNEDPPSKDEEFKVETMETC